MNWLRVQEILVAASELSGEALEELLEQECRGDNEVRRQVEQLLQEDIREPEDFERVFPSLAPGTSLGSYEIVRELGRGGMGTVYLASDSVNPQGGPVAVKVLDRGMDSPFAVSRFARERRVIASLEHPNIARFLDGGLMPDGRGYLAMEYLDGEPIDQYCDHHRLSIEQRLELFLGVCDAIQHAHQKLFVHRDIKPSNVFVTRDGAVKVLDFGTAKLLDVDHRQGGAASTALGLSLLTPAYASPEQLTGASVDTRTDVYGLGLLLFELLTGRRAYRFDGSSPIEFMHEVFEEEITKPSLVAMTEEVAELRSSQTARLRRRLTGDLDKIVLMALRKEPDRRYGSVEQMADDVVRYLAGLAVLANHGSVAYRTRKLLRRHPKKVTASAVATVSILVLGTGLVGQIHHTQELRDRAEMERDKAEQVSTFLVDLFERYQPDSQRGESPSAQDLLDRGAKKVLEASNQPPLLRATLLDALGTGYRRMALYDDALSHLEEARRLRQENLGNRHPETATSLDHLGHLYLELGRYDEALPLLEESLEIRQWALGGESPLVVKSLQGLAEAHTLAGRYELAETLARRSLELQEDLPDPDEMVEVISLRALGDILGLRNKDQEALAYLEQARTILERNLGREAKEVGPVLHDLGVIYHRTGELEQAETLLVRSLQIHERTLGKEHPHVAASRQALGALLYERGDLPGAEALMRQAIVTLTKALGAEHPAVGAMTYNLGYILFQAGDYERAEPLLEESLRIQEAAVGPEHPFLGYAVHSLGVIARHRGDLSEAERYLCRALFVRRAQQGIEQSPKLADSLQELSRVYLDGAQPHRAAQLLREALELRESAPEPDFEQIAETLDSLAEALELTGDLDSSRLVLESLLALRHRTLGPVHASTLQVLERIESHGEEGKVAKCQSCVQIAWRSQP